MCRYKLGVNRAVIPVPDRTASGRFRRNSGTLLRIYRSEVSRWTAEILRGSAKSYLHYFYGFVQDCSNSSALAVELLQSCTKPLIYNWTLSKNIR